MYNIYYILHTTYCILYTTYYILHTTYNKLHTIYYIIYTIHNRPYTIHSIPYRMYYTSMHACESSDPSCLEERTGTSRNCPYCDLGTHSRLSTSSNYPCGYLPVISQTMMFGSFEILYENP